MKVKHREAEGRGENNHHRCIIKPLVQFIQKIILRTILYNNDTTTTTSMRMHINIEITCPQPRVQPTLFEKLFALNAYHSRLIIYCFGSALFPHLCLVQ